MPKISIITTAYRHAAFISRTVESIQAQTFEDWELLIGDDNSPDNTFELASQYAEKDSRIRVWKNNPNLGIVGNTNFLISQVSAESEFVAFLEGDDLFVPENLQEKLAIFEKFPSVKLVYSDLSFIDKNDQVILESFFRHRHIPYFQNESIPIEKFILLKAGPIASWSSAMVRKEMLSEFPIVSLKENPTYSVSDYDFYRALSTSYHVYGIEKPLTLYRRHANNLSWANGGTSGDLAFLMNYYVENEIIDPSLFERKMSWISITFAVFSLERLNRKGAFWYWLDSWAFSPFHDLHYKFGLLGFLILPSPLLRKLLGFLIRRWN